MVVFSLAAVLSSSAASASEVFEVRGWDIERFDPDYVVEMIHKAHDAGMNTISLSHEIVMNAEEILWDWHRYKHLRRFCGEAHELGMKVYLWNHQINNPPPELIVSDPDTGRRMLLFDDPRLWDWLDDRYERVVARVPNLDGIILSLTESEFQIHREPDSPFWHLKHTGVISGKVPSERMAMVINTIHDALARHGKRLIVRDFLRTPEEMEASLQIEADVQTGPWAGRRVLWRGGVEVPAGVSAWSLRREMSALAPARLSVRPRFCFDSRCAGTVSDRFTAYVYSP